LHWRLGLFAVVGVVVLIALVITLGVAGTHEATVTYHTYFEESVDGLDVGSPVKYRGVTIGSVSKIDIAPDQRDVDVSLAIVVSELVSLRIRGTPPGFSFGRKPKVTLAIPPDLRTQLVSPGVTGVKYVGINFFDIRTNPLPVLGFAAPENYIPATSSTLKTVVDALTNAAARLPGIIDQAALLVATLNHIAGSFDKMTFPEHAAALLEQMGKVLTLVQTSLQQADVGKLSRQASEALSGIRKAVARVDAMLETMGSDKGLLSSVQRATDQIGDVAAGGKGLGSDLAETLRAVRDAADSIQHLADALDTDSDMLLKGRAKAP
jgi:paraquat-inducible protein B